MKKYLYSFLLLFVVGCGDGYSGYSNYTPYTSLSSHRKRTTGTSNLTHDYKDSPVLDVNDPLAKLDFERRAREYLTGVANDLKEVKVKAENAAEKIEAVIDVVDSGFDSFGLHGTRYVGSALVFKRESNFGALDYFEFPEFKHSAPTKPQKPLFLDDEFAVYAYNLSVKQYNREVADFMATAEDYVEDAQHYITNCKNDSEEIREKGLSLSRHMESLGMFSLVDL